MVKIKRTREEESLLQQYLVFTASPTRSRAERTVDFDRIRAMDMFDGLTFFKPHIMVIGTKTVYLKSSRGKVYEIGDFFIYLVRKRVGRRWVTEFYFENTTHPIYWNTKDDEGCIDHPHINRSKVPDDFDRPIGFLCIQHGQHSVYQSIREARIPDTMVVIYKILHTINRQSTYHDIDGWPRAKKRKGV